MALRTCRRSRAAKPHIERPYVSTLGSPGAALALVISVITFLVLFANPDYRPAIWWCAIWFLAGLAYFALYARFRMVRSPEEEFALVEGRKERTRQQERRLA